MARLQPDAATHEIRLPLVLRVDPVGTLTKQLAGLVTSEGLTLHLAPSVGGVLLRIIYTIVFREPQDLCFTRLRHIEMYVFRVDPDPYTARL